VGQQPLLATATAFFLIDDPFPLSTTSPLCRNVYTSRRRPRLRLAGPGRRREPHSLQGVLCPHMIHLCSFLLRGCGLSCPSCLAFFFLGFFLQQLEVIGQEPARCRVHDIRVVVLLQESVRGLYSPLFIAFLITSGQVYQISLDIIPPARNVWSTGAGRKVHTKPSCKKPPPTPPPLPRKCTYSVPPCASPFEPLPEAFFLVQVPLSTHLLRPSSSTVSSAAIRASVSCNRLTLFFPPMPDIHPKSSRPLLVPLNILGILHKAYPAFLKRGSPLHHPLCLRPRRFWQNVPLSLDQSVATSFFFFHGFHRPFFYHPDS